MAIIQCPECGGTLSDKAKKCVHCGAVPKTCPECETVWAGDSNVCPNCGFEIEIVEEEESTQETDAPAPQRPPIALSLFNSEPILKTIQNNLSGGWQFLFGVFGVISRILLVSSFFVPVLVKMIIPIETPDPVLIIATLLVLLVALVFYELGMFVSLFKDILSHSILKKQLNTSEYDVVERIRYELNEGWNACGVFDYKYKKENIATLINSQAQETSAYLKFVKYIIRFLFFFAFELPMAAICWTVIVTPVVLGVSFFPFGSINVFLANPWNWLFLGIWILLIIVCVVCCVAVYVIFSVICSAVEKKIRLKWMKQNMPDEVEAYMEKILKKKKKETAEKKEKKAKKDKKDKKDTEDNE